MKEISNRSTTALTLRPIWLRWNLISCYRGIIQFLVDFQLLVETYEVKLIRPLQTRITMLMRILSWQDTQITRSLELKVPFLRPLEWGKVLRDLREWTWSLRTLAEGLTQKISLVSTKCRTVNRLQEPKRVPPVLVGGTSKFCILKVNRVSNRLILVRIIGIRQPHLLRRKITSLRLLITCATRWRPIWTLLTSTHQSMNRLKTNRLMLTCNKNNNNNSNRCSMKAMQTSKPILKTNRYLKRTSNTRISTTKSTPWSTKTS